MATISKNTSFPPVHVKPLCDRTPEEKDAANRNDKHSHETLRALLRKPDNKHCADCTAERPGWAVLPHGIFVCINCAQIHRHIGRHISQVKGVTSGTYLWFPDEIEQMKLVGNTQAARVYAGTTTKPEENASRPEKEEYVRNKYERKKWYNPGAYVAGGETTTTTAKTATTTTTVATSAVTVPTAATTTSKPQAVQQQVQQKPVVNLMDMLLADEPQQQQSQQSQQSQPQQQQSQDPFFQQFFFPQQQQMYMQQQQQQMFMQQQRQQMQQQFYMQQQQQQPFFQPQNNNVKNVGVTAASWDTW